MRLLSPQPGRLGIRFARAEGSQDPKALGAKRFGMTGPEKLSRDAEKELLHCTIKEFKVVVFNECS